MELTQRPRRLRQNDAIRDLVQETRVSVKDLVFPLFIVPGKGIRREIQSMPGIYHLSIDRLEDELDELTRLQIPRIILFGIPEKKDSLGTQAYAEEGIIQQAVKEIKKKSPHTLVITDVCLCEYLDHGHCGLLKNDLVDNDATVELIAHTALSHAEAGVDMVAPSDMMDGRVQAIRKMLDARGFHYIPIMAYSAKYASAFYGPFREAVKSAPRFGDRSSYQLNSANRKEAIKEMELDILEGADIIMVKPALAYLDIIAQAKELFRVPIAAYNVSGEYAMVKAAASMGWIDETRAALEILTSIKRSGADIIITYFAKEYAKWSQQSRDIP